MPDPAAQTSSSHGLAAYRRVLAAPHVLPLTAASVLARLPIGMSMIALVLYVHGATGSFAAAGVVDGAFTIGLGVTGPLLARLIDRRGADLVILPGALISAAALVAVVLLGHADAGVAAMAAAAALGGAATPPVGGVVRQRLPQLVDAHDLPTIYAIDSIMIEAVFVGGPLLAGIIAVSAGAGAAMLATAGVGALGTVWFDVLVRAAPSNREEAHRGGWAGALASPTMRLLVFTGIPLGATFGALNVALPAFGAVHGNAALGGPFTASLAICSALGGLAYGARPHAFGAAPRAVLILGAMQVLTCLPVTLVATVPEMFVAAGLSGICVAPLVTVRNQLAKAGVVAGTGTEAFTWLGLSMTVGSAFGSALAGPVVEAAGWRAGAILACAMPLLSVGLGAAGRGVLAQRQPEAATAST